MFLLKALSDYLTITGCPLEKAQKCVIFNLFLVVVLLTCANLYRDDRKSVWEGQKLVACLSRCLYLAFSYCLG